MHSFHDLGGSAIMDIVKPFGEPVFPSMKGYEEAADAGEVVLGPHKLREMIIKRNDMQKGYMDHWAASATDGKPPVDGIISAVSAFAAPRLGATQTLGYVGYTGVWNLLGKSRKKGILRNC